MVVWLRRTDKPTNNALQSIESEQQWRSYSMDYGAFCSTLYLERPRLVNQAHTNANDNIHAQGIWK